MSRLRLVGLALLPVAVIGCPAPAPTSVPFTLLQANVGNAFLPCQDNYIFKLCQTEVEAHIRANVAALSPDVVAFQEILPDGWCDQMATPETDPQFVCHPDNVAGDPSQIHRILGDDYVYACDDRNGYECVAVKKFRELGASLAYAVAPPVPDTAGETCDPGFTVGAVTLTLQRQVLATLTLVNGHPQSGFIGECRDEQLHQVLDDLTDDGAAHHLLSGDWNLDPFNGTDPSVDTWDTNVDVAAAKKRFHYHSGKAERNPPFPTTDNILQTAVLDHVASDSLDGSCTTLGETPGTGRLDGESGGNGCDHRALFCTLQAPANPQLED